MHENIFPHHQQTIERTTDYYRADPNNLALLISGSIVKGLARPDSDVDIMLIVSDEEYDRRVAANEFTLYRPDLSTYEGGYVDGKYMNYQFLVDAAERGSEPTRWSFLNPIIAFSTIPDLESIIGQITTYPIHEQTAKIRSFYGQLFIMNYFVQEAEKRDNTYLMTHATADMVLYASRLILAHNQMLFPFHKWMMTEVQRAPDKPDDFIPLTETLLHAPNVQNAKALFECVANFRDWGVSVKEAVNAFAEDSERYWLQGRPAVSDW